MAQDSVQIKNASVVLGGYKALNNVSLKILNNKITGFIGPSGAGKTTLMRAIVGRQSLESGEITVFGQPAGSPELRRQLSYMTQEVSVYSDLTVQENLKYFAVMYDLPKNIRSQEIIDVAEVVGVSKNLNQLVQSLSGGQKQRVSLAIALLGKPKLLVLDEPTVGLDPLIREELWKLFKQLAESGHTLIISSHVMDEAERCDELVLIRNGQILETGSPSGLKSKTGTNTVEKSFLKLVGGNKQ